MIRLKLHELMAKRKIFKISELHHLTKKYQKDGVDRRILTALRNGGVGRVRFSVIDILCKVFQCEVGDLIEFAPDKKGQK